MKEVISNFANLLWGWPLIIVLFGTHLFLTIRLRLIQRFIFKAIKLSVSKDKSSGGDVSQFGALTTALAATIGTGNIVGVGTALALGGPGAILWTWITGFLGIATKYGEGVLGVKYRVKTSDGTILGGPMYACENGIKVKWIGKLLGVMFAVFTAFAAFGLGNMAQANSISAMAKTNFNLPPYITGIVLAIITAVVIIGGISKISKVCEVLVPFMAGFYIIGCLVILVINAGYIIPGAQLIFEAAFTPRAAASGFVGSIMIHAMRFGIARGLFSNESGLGSAPIVASAARTSNAVKQGLVSASGTFWDTVVVCALTGMVLVTTILSKPELTDSGKLSGGDLTNAAFANIPVIGQPILTVALLTFVFSTILGWSYYGERCAEYLLGKKIILPYKIAWIIFVFVGSMITLNTVFAVSDVLNAFMVIPNCISLVLLSGIIVKETRKYLWDDNIHDIDTDIAGNQ